MKTFTMVNHLQFQHGAEESMYRLWEAGEEMVRRLVYWSGGQHGTKRVLDLGTGCGVVACNLSDLRWKEVIGIDVDSDSIKTANKNAKRNDVQVTFECCDWKDYAADNKFDWILGADVLYEPEQHAGLVNCLSRNLRTRGKCIILDPRRPEALSFAARCRERGFKVSPLFDRSFMQFEVTHE